MPDLRGVTVHVTDASGTDLQEWGVQNLWGDKVSAYIQSKTDMPFRITILPKIPYSDDQQPPDYGHQIEEWEDVDGTQVKMEGVGDVSVIEQWATRRASGRKRFPQRAS